MYKLPREVMTVPNRYSQGCETIRYDWTPLSTHDCGNRTFLTTPTTEGHDSSRLPRQKSIFGRSST